MQNGIIRGTVVALLALGLGGCVSSGGGGGGGTTGGGTTGGGGASSGAFDAAVSRVQGLGATIDMPTSLNATFTGQARVDLIDSSTSATTGEAFADLDLAIDWVDGPSATGGVWSGSASNIQGTDDGIAFTTTGTLDVHAPTSSADAVSAAGVTTGSYMVNLAGELQVDDGTTVDTQYGALQLGGFFYGPGGSAMWGTAIGAVGDTPLAPGATSGDVLMSGEFYAEQ